MQRFWSWMRITIWSILKNNIPLPQWFFKILLPAGIVTLGFLAFTVVWFGWTLHAYIPFSKGIPFWLQLPWSAIVTFLGGLIVLFTYIANHRQKQQHFEREALDNQFKDILDRLANESPMLRANAVIRLAEMAEQKYPGKSSELIPDNYPFFSRAASQLSTSLHMERERAVRDEVVKSFRRISDFSSQYSQILLMLLIKELVDSNRTALRIFSEKLAEYFPGDQEVEDGHLFAVGQFAHFCHDDWINVYCLRAILNSSECLSARAATFTLQQANPIYDPHSKYDQLLCELREAATILQDTRDALAKALTGLYPPNDIPDTPENGFFLSKQFKLYWSRQTPLHLNKCFLAGADLTRVHLEGAAISSAFLHGAYLYQANLDLAFLPFTGIEGADIGDSSLRGSYLFKAHLAFAKLIRADLRGAILTSSQLWGTNLTEAKLNNAKLNDVQLDKQVGDKQCSAIFSDANWWDAIYSKDDIQKSWLNKMYPKDTQIPPMSNDNIVEQGNDIQNDEIDNSGTTISG